MKSVSKLAVGALAVLSCTSVLATNITFDITMKGIERYQAAGKKAKEFSLDKTYMEMALQTSGHVEGQSIDGLHEQGLTEVPNKGGKITVVDKGTLRYEDFSENINELVAAKVKSSWGKVKSIEISKDEYKRIYADVLQKTGAALLQKFSINTDEMNLSFSLDIKKIECSRLSDAILECNQEVKMIINANDETAANGSQIDKAISSAIKVTESYIGGIKDSTSYDFSSYVSVLEEIRAELPNSGLSNRDAANKLRSLKDEIHNEIMEQYKYDTIKGNVAKSYLRKFKSDLIKIQSVL